MSKSASDQTAVPEGLGTETSSSTVRGSAVLAFGADGGASITTRFERVPAAGLSAGMLAGARALLGDAVAIAILKNRRKTRREYMGNRGLSAQDRKGRRQQTGRQTYRHGGRWAGAAPAADAAGGDEGGGGGGAGSTS